MKITGNDTADTLAKEAILSGNSQPSFELSISHPDIANGTHNPSHLHKIQPNVTTRLPLPSTRQDQVLISRLRLGHSSVQESLPPTFTEVRKDHPSAENVVLCDNRESFLTKKFEKHLLDSRLGYWAKSPKAPYSDQCLYTWYPQGLEI